MKNLLRLSIAALLLLLSMPFTTAADNLPEKQIWIHKKDGCNHGLYKQPKGPMALLLFCEDALGTYIGLVYYEHMGSPVPYGYYSKLSQAEKDAYFTIWSLNNRMWQDPIWASDVTSYVWGPDGTKLYVATSEIYGSGALYELDLIRKKYKQIAPSGREAKLNAPGPGYIITQIDQDNNKLIYVQDPQSDTPIDGLLKLFYILK